MTAYYPTLAVRRLVARSGGTWFGGRRGAGWRWRARRFPGSRCHRRFVRLLGRDFLGAEAHPGHQIGGGVWCGVRSLAARLGRDLALRLLAVARGGAGLRVGGRTGAAMGFVLRTCRGFRLGRPLGRSPSIALFEAPQFAPARERIQISRGRRRRGSGEIIGLRAADTAREDNEK
jgi:hypothetical protein